MTTDKARAKIVARIKEAMEHDLYNPVGDHWGVGGVGDAAQRVVDVLLSDGVLVIPAEG